MDEDIIESEYLGLPSDTDIAEGLRDALDIWRDRNKFIIEMRDMLGGKNKIEAPTNTPYKIKTLHTYLLAAIANEKAARFVQLPNIQVIPEGDDPSHRAKSSELESAINILLAEIERRGDGDVWSRCVLDAIILDEGVERIECAPSAFWPEVVTANPDGTFKYPLEDIESKNYKKEYGAPLRNVYVPLENFFPVYEGSTLVESFEVEKRTLREVLRNPLFSVSGKSKLEQYRDSQSKIKIEVNIVHYVNQVYHAYYALTPGTAQTFENNKMPDLTSLDAPSVGQPILLYAYVHGLGQSLYNCIAGRFGGWKTNSNRIEGVGKGLLELNQAADDLISQVYTNTRAKYWPSLKHVINPELRGATVGDPKPLTFQEGQSLAIYKDESVEPLFKPEQDPMVIWFYDRIQEQVGRLGGSPVIYGQNQPGVDTGYHQNLQITQAEHLDEKIEQHLSVGASQRATIMLKHIKKMDLGEVYVYASTEEKSRKVGKYYSIDPVDLSPLPRMDVQVRRPKPIDFVASIRAAIDASNEREGKGPLLSDDSIRANILNLPAPENEQRKIIIEQEKRNILSSGIISTKVQEALNLKLVANSVPEINPSMMNEVDPALQNALGMMDSNGQGASNTPAPANGYTPTGTQTGMPTGQSQPEAINGNALANAVSMGQ